MLPLWLIFIHPTEKNQIHPSGNLILSEICRKEKDQIFGKEWQPCYKLVKEYLKRFWESLWKNFLRLSTFPQNLGRLSGKFWEMLKIKSFHILYYIVICFLKFYQCFIMFSKVLWNFSEINAKFSGYFSGNFL